MYEYLAYKNDRIENNLHSPKTNNFGHQWLNETGKAVCIQTLDGPKLSYLIDGLNVTATILQIVCNCMWLLMANQ